MTPDMDKTIHGDFYARECEEDCEVCVFSVYPYRCTKMERRQATEAARREPQ